MNQLNKQPSKQLSKKTLSKEDLLLTFRDLDRDEVQIPASFQFPLVISDYVSWLEPSGHRTYLVFLDPETDSTLGVVFRRTRETDENTAHMCEWCHSVRGADAIGLLSATASQKRRIGLYLCRDLSCKEKALARPGVHDIPEALTSDIKIQRIVSRMSGFAKRNLF